MAIKVNGKISSVKTARGKKLSDVLSAKQQTVETEKGNVKEIKEYKLVAEITHAEPRKNSSGIYAGDYFYVLSIKPLVSGFENIRTLYCSKQKLLDPTVWELIEKDEWFGKKFLLYYTKTSRYSNFYWLLKWKIET